MCYLLYWTKIKAKLVVIATDVIGYFNDAWIQLSIEVEYWPFLSDRDDLANACKLLLEFAVEHWINSLQWQM